MGADYNILGLNFFKRIFLQSLLHAYHKTIQLPVPYKTCTVQAFPRVSYKAFPSTTFFLLSFTTKTRAHLLPQQQQKWQITNYQTNIRYVACLHNESSISTQ